MVRVLIVDDSAAMRRFLAQELSKDPDIEIVGGAPDPYVARDLILSENPDVITLDLEMPRMDGLTFLRRIMKHRPMPVVVFSSLTPQGGSNALEALAAGAVDVLCKPANPEAAAIVAAQLADCIKDVVGATVGHGSRPPAPTPHTSTARGRERILAFGASTGGTVALETILKSFRPGETRSLIVQHMPEVFTKSFADRLARVCELDIREAQDGDGLDPGSVLVAPGGKHMVLRRTGHSYHVEIKGGPTVNGHRPSIDVTFSSVAECAGPQTVGVILTGMGRDGASGLLQIRNAGGRTLAQDEATSVVFGMPKVAIQIGAAEEVCAVTQVPAHVTRMLDEDPRRAAASAS